MIRFSCEQCGCRISVRDENAGRIGECPKCKNALLVPKKLNTIELQCEKCGQKISVLRKKSAQTGRCPNCRNPILVPGTEKAVSKPKKETPDDTNSYLLGNDAGLTLLEVPDELKFQDLLDKPSKVAENLSEEELSETAQIEESKSEEQRSAPWFIDIFLYPVNQAGLTNLALFTIVPMVCQFLGLIGFIIRMLMGLYFGWYLTECVRDSANGATRAPEAFASMGVREMWAQMQHIVGCYLILIFPAFLYSVYAHKTDAIYWGLLIAGSFFFPMGLLACIMFDSIRGLNPILLLGSIFSTFFQYCGLVILVVGIVFALTVLLGMFESNSVRSFSASRVAIDVGVFALLIYTAFIVVHLIGRFYRANEEKLNWEC